MGEEINNFRTALVHLIEKKNRNLLLKNQGINFTKIGTEHPCVTATHVFTNK